MFRVGVIGGPGGGAGPDEKCGGGRRDPGPGCGGGRRGAANAHGCCRLANHQRVCSNRRPNRQQRQRGGRGKRGHRRGLQPGNAIAGPTAAVANPSAAAATDSTAAAAVAADPAAAALPLQLAAGRIHRSLWKSETGQRAARGRHRGSRKEGAVTAALRLQRRLASGRLGLPRDPQHKQRRGGGAARRRVTRSRRAGRPPAAAAAVVDVALGRARRALGEQRGVESVAGRLAAGFLHHELASGGKQHQGAGLAPLWPPIVTVVAVASAVKLLRRGCHGEVVRV